MTGAGPTHGDRPGPGPAPAGAPRRRGELLHRFRAGQPGLGPHRAPRCGVGAGDRASGHTWLLLRGLAVRACASWDRPRTPGSDARLPGCGPVTRRASAGRASVRAVRSPVHGVDPRRRARLRIAAKDPPDARIPQRRGDRAGPGKSVRVSEDRVLSRSRRASAGVVAAEPMRLRGFSRQRDGVPPGARVADTEARSRDHRRICGTSGTAADGCRPCPPAVACSPSVPPRPIVRRGVSRPVATGPPIRVRIRSRPVQRQGRHRPVPLRAAGLPARVASCRRNLCPYRLWARAGPHGRPRAHDRCPEHGRLARYGTPRRPGVASGSASWPETGSAAEPASPGRRMRAQGRKRGHDGRAVMPEGDRKVLHGGRVCGPCAGRPGRTAPGHGSACRAAARGSGHARCAGGITGHGDVGRRAAGSEGKVFRPLASRLAGPVLRPGHCRCRGDPRGPGTCLRCTSPVDRFASGSRLRNRDRARRQRFGTGEPGPARVAPGTAGDRAPFRGRRVAAARRPGAPPGHGASRPDSPAPDGGDADSGSEAAALQPPACQGNRTSTSEPSSSKSSGRSGRR